MAGSTITTVLADFALHFGVGKHKRIVLAIDQAGWHTSELVEVPLMHSFGLVAFSLSRTTTRRTPVAFDQ